MISAYNHEQVKSAAEIYPNCSGLTGVTSIVSPQKKLLRVLPGIRRLVPGVIAGFLLIVLDSTPGFATHEIDHRFIVWGQVLTSDGEPVSGETISFTVAHDTPIGSVVTDEQGRYRVVLHVHDQDLGKVFDMTVKGVKTKVKIEFDPEDKVTERGKRMDFTIEQ